MNFPLKIKNRTSGEKMIDPALAIKISADSIEELRKVDVYRVLSTYEDAKIEIGQYIKENRADMAEEVESVIHELRPF